jgi:xylulokinase
MEGVAYAVANCVDAIQAIARQVDRPVTTFRTGRSGGSQLATWRQILTDSLDQAIEVVDASEPGCLGTALLAGVGTGCYPDIPSAVQQAVRVAEQSAPDPETAALYRERRLVFNDAYRALAPHV